MNFLTTLCMAALATALFRMLVPENNFSKQISILIAAVFILTGITAEELGDQISSDVNEQIRQKICSDMSDRIFALLNSREIYPEEIHIAVNISGLYSINITQVELVFKSGEQAAANAAAELLRTELSPDTNLRITY